MICTQCKTKEVTSKLTMGLCSSCFFTNRNSLKGKDNESQESTNTEINKEEIINRKNNQDTRTSGYGGNTSENRENTERNTIISICEIEDCPDIATEAIGNKQLCSHHANESIQHVPSKSKVTTIPNDGKKYCQSCIERFGSLTLATREWTENYFICNDCFQPLLNNLLGIERSIDEGKIKTGIDVNSPILPQLFTLFEVPEHLRFNSSDKAALKYNDFFNHHSTTIVNQTLEQLVERIELIQTLFSTIKPELHALTDRVNKLKYVERERNQVEKIEKSRSEIKGPSKIKMGKLEKEAKSLGLSLEQYQKFIGEVKQAEFDKIIKGGN